MQSQKSLSQLSGENQISRDLIRDSLEKTRIGYQKLMIFQVLTSKSNIFSEMTEQANKISKKALGVNVHAIHTHPNSNLRALGYILICALVQPQRKMLAMQMVNDKVNQVQQKVVTVKNYYLTQKFNVQDMLNIFLTMLTKIQSLLEGGLQIHEIIKVHASYLDVTTYFLRCLLAYLNFKLADDFSKKLPTHEIYPILGQYLDLEYQINKNIYLFPDLKLFVASPDDNQFIFGKYYSNTEQLHQHQSQVRQSTIEHINKLNENYQSMKISKMNLDVSMSQCMFQQRFAQALAPISSKAPTPEFGDTMCHGFEELLGYNSEEELSKAKKDHNKSSNQKDTKNETISHNFNQQQKIGQKSAFTKKMYQQQMISPAATSNNKNIIGSAFYLHEFDFYKRNSQQPNNQFEKMCSERILLKGSSMVEQGQLFLQQIQQLKKQKQTQINDRTRQRRKMVKKDIEQTISAHTLGHSNEERSRNHSAHSQNARSQKVYDNRSSSDISKKLMKTMKITSDVYNINIKNDHKPKDLRGTQNYSRSTSQSKISGKVKQSTKIYKTQKTDHIFFNPLNQKAKGKINEKNKLHVTPRSSQYEGTMGQTFSDHFLNQNHNHIHIHIHNDSKLVNGNGQEKNTNTKVENQESFAKKKQFHYKFYNGSNLQTTFQHAIPEIIKQIQTNNIQRLQKEKPKIYQFKQPKKIGEVSKKVLQNRIKNAQSNFQLKQNTLIPSRSENIIYKSPRNQVLNEQNLVLEGKALKKRKSEDGTQIITQQLSRNEKSSSVIKRSKPYPHIPSFLRKKQKSHMEEFQKSKQNEESYQIFNGMRKQTSHSPAEARVSREKYHQKGDKKVYNQKYNLKIKGKVMGKCSVDLKTPTFGSPQTVKK